MNGNVTEEKKYQNTQIPRKGYYSIMSKEQVLMLAECLWLDSRKAKAGIKKHSALEFT